MGRAAPRPLFGLAPGGVYHATSVSRSPVRSYRTLSPLPVPSPLRAAGHRRSALCGTFRRLCAEALGLPGVTRHPALWSSDFPPSEPPKRPNGDPHFAHYHTDSDEKSGATGAGSPIVISVEKLKVMECTHKRGVGHATAVGRKLRWAPPPFQPPAHTGCWCLTQQTQQQEHGRREPNSLVRHRLLAQPNPPAPNCHPDEQLLTRTLAGQRA